MNNFNNTENILIEDQTQFPSLEQAKNMTVPKSIPHPHKPVRSNNRSETSRRKNVVTFDLFTSYYDENPHKFKPIYEKETIPQLTPEELRKRREFTRACQHVIDYGVCYRQSCTFAHSFDELKVPLCNFGDQCKFIHGKYDYKTATVNKNDKCRFKHPKEDVQQYHARIGKELPQLPKTSECSRQKKGERKKTLNLGKVSIMNRPIEYKYRKKE